MKKIGKDIWLILFIFIISRVIISLFGIHFRYEALERYWQYLDVETLQHNLLKGVWYDHAQPPFFNLFLGVILKLFGNGAEFVFSALFKLITLANVFLILTILKRITSYRHLPLIISLIYLLSPASMIFETELFYTTFISMLLLISAHFILEFRQGICWKKAIGFFLPLVIKTAIFFFIVCLKKRFVH